MIASFTRRALFAAVVATGLTFSVTGCASSDAHEHPSALAGQTEGVAVLIPTKGNTTAGVVRFSQSGHAVKIVGVVSGLTPGQHAMHIHEFGDGSSADGTSAGSHYNPEGHAHGAPGSGAHHAGDFGNITADASGNSTFELTVHNITVAGVTNPIVGRALVIHAKADDFTQPVGNAGPRVAVGIIGLGKVAAPAAPTPAK